MVATINEQTALETAQTELSEMLTSAETDLAEAKKKFLERFESYATYALTESSLPVARCQASFDFIRGFTIAVQEKDTAKGMLRAAKKFIRTHKETARIYAAEELCPLRTCFQMFASSLLSFQG